MPRKEPQSKTVAGAVPFGLTEALFLRLLGLIYLVAFGSLWRQINGLIGSRGIVPAVQVLQAMRAELGSRAFFEVPTLFWFGISDAGLIWCCILGCITSAFLITGMVPRWSAAICFLLYLSLVSVGQPFTAFQWDALLLESGFLALFVGAPWLIWAYRFLLFRLMFESGAVKLLSHDPNWRNFHALRFHFMTQPLPNPIAYYVYWAPTWILDSMTAATLVIELAAPFLLFAPKIVRYISTGSLMLLQLLILVTGNYAFFNLLALALCLCAFDEQTFSPLARVLRWRMPCIGRACVVLPHRLCTGMNAVLCLLIAIGAVQVIGLFAPVIKRPLSRPLELLAPFQIVNTYGLFAVMTTSRPEIIIEGSDDQLNWKEYSFPYKPGNLHRGLPFVAPYQPRLDWQMWFAALGSYPENSWVGSLMYRLLLGDMTVSRLLNQLPFSKPPRFIRALLYSYEFTTPDERARTGAVWRRQLRGEWFGPVSLRQQ